MFGCVDLLAVPVPVASVVASRLSTTESIIGLAWMGLNGLEWARIIAFHSQTTRNHNLRPLEEQNPMDPHSFIFAPSNMLPHRIDLHDGTPTVTICFFSERIWGWESSCFSWGSMMIVWEKHATHVWGDVWRSVAPPLESSGRGKPISFRSKNNNQQQELHLCCRDREFRVERTLLLGCWRWKRSSCFVCSLQCLQKNLK